MKKKRRHATKRTVLIFLLLLLIMTVIAAYVIVRDYRERPGILERASLKADERGIDHITLSWDKERNIDKYVIWYKPFGSEYDEWTRLDIDAAETEQDQEAGAGSSDKDDKDKERSRRASITIDGLEEGTEYVFTIRPDSEEREGFRTDGKVFATRSSQKIEIARKVYTKLTSSKAFQIKAEAATRLSYSSSDEEVVKVNSTGKVSIKGEGAAKITITAAESRDYIAAETKIRILVIGNDPVKASGAKAKIIYNLGPDNCEAVKKVWGNGGIHVPQSFGYTGKDYIIAYDGSGAQRIITYSVKGSDRKAVKPKIDLGHPNGFTYCNYDKRCYSVRGWIGRTIIYDPKSGEFDEMTLPYGCSGIGYDRKKKLMYTSSRTAMIAYDVAHKWNIKYRTGVVKHRGKVYTQDCGGYGGILLHCMSGSSKHGTNYIDMYDMIHGKYLGSFACELSEVESVIVDKDGFLQILANNSTGIDYIWRSEINIADIAAGIGK